MKICIKYNKRNEKSTDKIHAKRTVKCQWKNIDKLCFHIKIINSLCLDFRANFTQGDIDEKTMDYNKRTRKN